MKRMIYVRARPGVQVPREGAARRYITAGETVAVMSSSYYRRQIRDGDLLQVPAPVLAPVPDSPVEA